MMTSDLPTLLATRRADIQSEIADLNSQLAALRQELSEIAVAQRVIARLAGADDEGAEEFVDSVATPAKPENIPTMPDMIRSVLTTAKGGGLRGMEPKDITVRIAQTYWPEVRPEAVSSIAWRMWKRGELQKDGALYMLPESVGGALSLAAATRFIEGAGVF